jgi:undecaprenyl-diphosphatase
MTDLWIAAILGIVEGLTEFLPVSSTGHLIVVGNLMDFSGEKAKTFQVFIQLGAILAVLILYWPRFAGLIPLGGLRWGAEEGFTGARGLALLALTTIPALLIGLLAHRLIKTYLFGPITVACALGIGGAGIILAEKFKPQADVEQLDGLTYRHALFIGLFQCISLWPGVSRAAATIVGGLLSGLERRVATEYSFLAAVPIMIAATSYDLYKGLDFLQLSDFSFFATGFTVSFVSATAAIKTFMALVRRWSLLPYAWYRILVSPLIYLWM